MNAEPRKTPVDPGGIVLEMDKQIEKAQTVFDCINAIIEQSKADEKGYPFFETLHGAGILYLLDRMQDHLQEAHDIAECRTDPEMCAEAGVAT